MQSKFFPFPDEVSEAVLKQLAPHELLQVRRISKYVAHFAQDLIFRKTGKEATQVQVNLILNKLSDAKARQLFPVSEKSIRLAMRQPCFSLEDRYAGLLLLAKQKKLPEADTIVQRHCVQALNGPDTETKTLFLTSACALSEEQLDQYIIQISEQLSSSNDDELYNAIWTIEQILAHLTQQHTAVLYPKLLAHRNHQSPGVRCEIISFLAEHHDTLAHSDSDDYLANLFKDIEQSDPMDVVENDEEDDENENEPNETLAMIHAIYQYGDSITSQQLKAMMDFPQDNEPDTLELEEFINALLPRLTDPDNTEFNQQVVDYFDSLISRPEFLEHAPVHAFQSSIHLVHPQLRKDFFFCLTKKISCGLYFYEIETPLEEVGAREFDNRLLAETLFNLLHLADTDWLAELINKLKGLLLNPYVLIADQCYQGLKKTYAQMNEEQRDIVRNIIFHWLASDDLQEVTSAIALLEGIWPDLIESQKEPLRHVLMRWYDKLLKQEEILPALEQGLRLKGLTDLSRFLSAVEVGKDKPLVTFLKPMLAYDKVMVRNLASMCLASQIETFPQERHFEIINSLMAFIRFNPTGYSCANTLFNYLLPNMHILNKDCHNTVTQAFIFFFKRLNARQKNETLQWIEKLPAPSIIALEAHGFNVTQQLFHANHPSCLSTIIYYFKKAVAAEDSDEWSKVMTKSQQRLLALKESDDPQALFIYSCFLDSFIDKLCQLIPSISDDKLTDLIKLLMPHQKDALANFVSICIAQNREPIFAVLKESTNTQLQRLVAPLVTLQQALNGPIGIKRKREELDDEEEHHSKRQKHVNAPH